MDMAFQSEKGAPASNEDAGWADDNLGAFLVCDGLASSKASELAAQILKKTLQDNFALIEECRSGGNKEKRKQLEAVIDSGVQEASKQIFLAAGADPKLHGMCTSVDLLVFAGTHALVAHVGSGRVYLLRNAELHQLTDDHTQLAHLRRAGKLETIPEAQQLSYAKKITKAVGFRDQVKVDHLEVELAEGDKFLMMTDGVWLPINEGGLQGLANVGGNSQAILNGLHRNVLQTGAKDNYTTVVVEPPMPRVSFEGGSAEQKLKMLGKVSAFEYLSYQELLKVLSTGELFKVKKDSFICKEGDQGGEMMLILSGEVDVLKNDKKIRELGRGDVFGELSMFDAAPRSASVKAVEATNLLAFPRKPLFLLFRENPEIAVKFLWGVTMETNKRLRMASNKMVGRPENEGLEVKVVDPLPFLRSK